MINTSRGPIVDEAVLVAALGTGRIASAGLDVYDMEPLPHPHHALWSLQNVTLSPHLGYLTRKLLGAIHSETVEDVMAWLKGAPLRLAQSEAVRRQV